MVPQRLFRLRRTSGFTLIEIMVVVVIIGLLAAIVAPNVVRQLDKASINRAKADITTIRTAMTEFYSEYYRYPTEDEGLQILAGAGPDPTKTNLPKFIERVPKDPWNRPYLYKIPGDHGDYDIYTYGADGKEDQPGADTAGSGNVNADIGNWNLE